MKTVADAAVARSLVVRLTALSPDSQRRWGTLSAHEMLCHLGDATDMVLGIRPRKHPVLLRRRRIVKLIGLWAPFRWPHGWKTNPQHDPRADGTRPSEFERDLKRAIAGIEGIAAADHKTLEPAHGFFGTMSLIDWQRWTYKHSDHHLRQFGV